MKHNVRWWTAATPSPCISLADSLKALCCWFLFSPLSSSDCRHIQPDNGIISFPRLICCTGNSTDWDLIVCEHAGLQLFFQRWKLMLSLWQHCYSTNSPDGVFMPSFSWKNVRFSDAKHKTAHIVFVFFMWPDPITVEGCFPLRHDCSNRSRHAGLCWVS